MSKVHIGKKIKEVLDKSHYTVIEFAKLIGLTRDGVYKIFAKEFIDTDQLNKISKVLNHDFFKHFSQDLSLLKEPKDTFGYASKDDVVNILHLIEKLSKKIDDIQERLPAKEPAKKKKYAKTTGKI
jgi:hypothetical protein